MGTRIIETKVYAPPLIKLRDREHTISFGAHPGDSSRVDVIVDDEVWINGSQEDWWRVIAHLSSQGFHSPTMAQQCAMEDDSVEWRCPDRAVVVRKMVTDRLMVRPLVALFRKLGRNVYVATELVDGTTIYERIDHV